MIMFIFKITEVNFLVSLRKYHDVSIVINDVAPYTPCLVELNWLFNVTINDISVIYVTAHRCAGGLKKKFDLRSGSQRHRHFVGFFNVPVLAPTRDQPFYTVIPTHRPI